MQVPQTRISFPQLLKQWVIIALGVSLASWMIDGIQFESATSLVLAVLFISLLNVFLKPVLVLMGLPFIVMTLGLGLIFINALIFAMVGTLVPGFHVYGFWPAFWGAIVVSLTTMVVNVFLARPQIRVTRVQQVRSDKALKAKGGAKEYRGKLDDVIDV
ncbi:MAG: phage holin family protein [Verrucomicrobiae bacterium]|nr:phage holin family protein [Verrucomicrobiae bacterium]